MDDWKEGDEAYVKVRIVAKADAGTNAEHFVSFLRQGNENVGWFDSLDLIPIPSAPPVMAGAATAIRAQAFEEAAKLVEPANPRPCDCDRCYCGNNGDAEAVAQWDADTFSAKSIRALIDRPAPGTSSIHVIFDGPPSHESGRFVEVENDAGFSISVGEWAQRPDGLWDLVIPVVVSAAALSAAPGRADAETRKIIIDAFKESCEFHGAYDVAGIILRACTAIDAALPPIAGERQS